MRSVLCVNISSFYINQLNMLEVPSNINEDVSEVSSKRKSKKRKKMKNKENNNKNVLRFKPRNRSENISDFDNCKSQSELDLNVNSISHINRTRRNVLKEVNHIDGTNTNKKNAFLCGVHKDSVVPKSCPGSIDETEVKSTGTVLSNEVQCNDIVGTTTNKWYHDPKLNSQCMVLLEKLDHRQTVKKLPKNMKNIDENIDKFSKTLQINDINTQVDYKLSEAKLSSQCVVRLESFNNSIKCVQSNNIKVNDKKKIDKFGYNALQNSSEEIGPGPHLKFFERKNSSASDIKSSNKIETTIQEKSDKLDAALHNGGVRSATDSKLWRDPKLYLKCIILLEKVDANPLSGLSMENNKLPEKSKITTEVHGQSMSTKYLRQRHKKNYAEISINDSQEIAITNSVLTKKIPIYKIQQKPDTNTKNPDDLYEFDEFDIEVIRNPRNQKHSINNSRKFDRTMYDILQNIKMKEAKLKEKHKNKKGSSKNKRPGKKNIQEVQTEQNEMPIADSNKIQALKETQNNELCDFIGVSHSTPLKKNPNINIISDLILNQNDSFDLFDSPKSNSSNTLGLSKNNCSPWRFNDNLKHSHFINTKSTALPCLQQDMVLDFVEVEKIEERFSKTPKKNQSPKRKMVQKSILDFMNISSNDISNRENIPHSSLFDYENFSPEKNNSQNVSVNKAKRNILTPRNENSFKDMNGTVISTQNKHIASDKSIEISQNDDIDTYFGFDDDDDEVVPSKNKIKLLEARPYRINQNVIKKRAEKVAEIQIPEENSPNLSELVECEPDGKEVGLFEGPEQVISPTKPSKMYQRKRKKARLLSIDRDGDEGHKKKKYFMTKEEEAELENWTKQFNIMCEEVDKHELEIQ